MALGKIVEPSRETPVVADVDVLVVGGGPAGVAAAVSAARQGRSTMLIERYGFLGGMATAGLVTTFCGLYMIRGGDLVPVVRGFADEVLERLRAKEGLGAVVNIAVIALVPFDNYRYKLVADDLVQESGARLRLHSLVVGAVLEGRQVRGVIVESKSGRQAILTKVVVDATGDGDVAALSGARFANAGRGHLQFPSTIFQMGNVDLEKAATMHFLELQQLMAQVAESGEFDLPRVGMAFQRMPNPGQVHCNITRVHRDGESLDGTDVDDLTYGEVAGRRQIGEYVAFLRKYVPGFERAYVVDAAPQLGIRETRLVAGEYVLQREDVLEAHKFDDGIACGAWPIEMHGGGRMTQWEPVKAEDFYQVPYRCLVPVEIDNLLVAGRCLSASHDAQASVRVSAMGMATGQAAGLAAAMAAERGITPRAIPAGDLRQRLRRAGAFLGTD